MSRKSEMKNWYTTVVDSFHDIANLLNEIEKKGLKITWIDFEVTSTVGVLVLYRVEE